MYAQPPFRRRPLSLAVATLSTLMSMPALADQTSSVTEAEAIVVYGSTYRNTATKTALEPMQTPQGITVIERETLDQRGVDTVAQALRYVPGVATELRGGAVSRLDLFNIRGFDNYQTFYDGLQLLYNDWNLQPQIDAFALEQIEVFKGPTSVLYGAMSPGGMVNQIAKQPSSEEYNSVKFSLGSQNLFETSFESRGQVQDSDLSYSLVALARDKEGQATTSEERRYLVAPSIDWQVSDRTLVNFNLYYQNDPDMGIYTSLPASGLFLPNSNGELQPDAFSGDANWNTYDREQLLVGYKINHQFNDQWTFLHNARFMDAEALQENTYLSGGLLADQRTINRRAYLTDEESEAFTIDNQLSGLVDIGSAEHNLLIGIDYSYLDSDIIYKDGAIPTIDLFNPDHHQIDRSSLALPDYNSDFELIKEQLGFYVQDQIRWDRWVLIAGGRWDHTEAREKGTKYGGLTDTRLKQNNFSPRVGALYQLDNGFAPFVSYSESFEPLAGIDRNGNEFKPSTGEQAEAGVKYESNDGSSSMTLSAYRILKKNVPTRDPNGGPYDQIQAGEVRSEGVEFDANFQATDALSLYLAYTYTDVEVTKDNSGLQGKKLIWVPEHTATGWANYAFGNGVDLGAGVRYIGEQQIDALNSHKVPDATLVDLSVGYDLGSIGNSIDNARLTVAVSNLFDKRYYSCYDSNNCWFGAERTIKASMKMEF